MRTDEDWVSAVLAFWFGELDPKDWFETSEAVDATIRARFGELHDRLVGEFTSMSFDDPRTALATILVFDQFPRNMFRGQPQAFATDDMAAAIARKAIEREFDAQVPEEQRVFFYMPLMHSENVADQEHCVSLCAALEGDYVRHAVEHRDIVARFGRFPHRNRVLGRENTEPETVFLGGHKGFGQ